MERVIGIIGGSGVYDIEGLEEWIGADLTRPDRILALSEVVVTTGGEQGEGAEHRGQVRKMGGIERFQRGQRSLLMHRGVRRREGSQSDVNASTMPTQDGPSHAAARAVA